MKLGVIGIGHWGRNYVRVLQEIGQEVVSVADRDPARLEEIGARFPHLERHEDARSVLGHPGLDAVVIASPASSHYRLASAALDEGKHVLVEKPMSLAVHDAERLLEQANRLRRVLMVGHTFLYNDAVRRLRELLREPQSGEVYYSTSRRTHLGLIREDVSALWDLAPHDVSILCYLHGVAPDWVNAIEVRALRAGQGDAAFLTLGFPDGKLGQIEVSWVDAHKIRDLVVVTSRRRIVFDDLNLMEPLRVYEKGVTIERDVPGFGEFKYLLRDGDIVSPRVELREPLRNLCQHFAECVETGSVPLSGGESGLAVVRVLAAAERSIQRDGAPEPVR